MTGKVVKISGSLALVEQAEKSSPCDMCKSPCVQRSCEKTKKISLWANNPLSADAGDTVETEEAKNKLPLLYGVLCFALPTATAAAGFICTAKLSEGYRMLAALVGFAICEIISVLICSAVSKRCPALVITDVIHEKEQKIQNGDL